MTTTPPKSGIIDAEKPEADAEAHRGARRWVSSMTSSTGTTASSSAPTAGDAEDYKIVTAPVANPGPENWTDLIPHRPGIFLVGFIVLKNWLVRMERENALPRIVVRDMASGEEHAIAFDEEAYSLGFGEMREYDTDVLRFTYSSMTTPSQVFDYDMRDRTRVLRKMQEMPSGHDPTAYVTRRMHGARRMTARPFPSRCSTARRRSSTARNRCGSMATAPMAFRIPAGFNSNILSLVDRGFIYAIAHIRGGQEKGRRWYKTGKLELKDQYLPRLHRGGEFLIGAGLHAAAATSWRRAAAPAAC